MHSCWTSSMRYTIPYKSRPEACLQTIAYIQAGVALKSNDNTSSVLSKSDTKVTWLDSGVLVIFCHAANHVQTERFIGSAPRP
jgi:hypothetical protein